MDHLRTMPPRLGQFAMSQEGIRAVRSTIARVIVAAVCDGTIEPREAATVLQTTLALMVAAVRDERLRADYVRDVSAGFPMAVAIARSEDGTAQHRC